MTALIRLPIIVIIFFLFPSVYGQEINSDSLLPVPAKIITKINDRVESCSKKIDHQTEKYLHKLEKQEQMLKNKLSKVDSLAANNIFTHSISDLRGKASAITQKIQGNPLKEYIPGLDTLGSVLAFLQINPQAAAIKKQLDDALKSFEILKSKLKNAEDFKEYIRERRAYIAGLLQQHGLKKELGQYNRMAAEYSEAFADIKATLNNSAKIEQILIKQLNNIPAFRDFVGQNSFLSGLFNAPATNTITKTVFQNRAVVNQLLQQNSIISSSNPAQLMQARAVAARTELARLRNMLTGNGTKEMPDYEPSGKKRKTILQKIEYGFNCQFDKKKNYFPSTANIALQAGYRINKKSIIGVGVNYKAGLGEGWNRINLTHEGIGIRSFLKWKIKGNWSIAGGYEWDHLDRFRTYRNLLINPSWQKSGMMGLSKTFKAGKKMNGEIQLLYDLLNNQQSGTGQPFVFRIGYSFKK